MQEPTSHRFQPIGSYEYPPVPAEESLRKFRDRIGRWLRAEQKDPFITSQELQIAETKWLDEIIPPPQCGPLKRELDETLEGWIAEDRPSKWLQVVLSPPGERPGFLEQWARCEGHTVIPPPDRNDLIGTSAIADSGLLRGSLSKDRVLVVPRLEDWFLRHRKGLRLVRKLIDEIALQRQHMIIGCGSWAWNYLTRAVGVVLVFPKPITFTAFDAPRLRSWFEELAVNNETPDETFRLITSGEDIFAQKSNASPKCDYLDRLAAHSLGIPWVAWHIWRDSLRIGPSKEEKEAQKFPEERTIWVSDLPTFTLPADCHAESLLAVHAMLLHGSLTADELADVLPALDHANLLVALVARGIAQQDGGRFSCSPVAYPSMRSQLLSAGYSPDQL